MSMTKAEARSVARSAERIIDTRPVLIGVAVLMLFVAILRLYEQLFAWRFGLDSFSPEFQLYWMGLLQFAIMASSFAAIGLVGFLWRTRIAIWRIWEPQPKRDGSFISSSGCSFSRSPCFGA